MENAFEYSVLYICGEKKNHTYITKIYHNSNFNDNTVTDESGLVDVLRRDPSVLPLANCEDLSGTPHSTLGVILFPLSPPSYEGTTHINQRKDSSQLASQGRATTLYLSWISQLPKEKSVKKNPAA